MAKRRVGSAPQSLRQGAVGAGRCNARELPKEDAHNRALALDDAFQALELLGMGIAAGLAAQGLAFSLHVWMN